MQFWPGMSIKPGLKLNTFIYTIFIISKAQLVQGLKVQCIKKAWNYTKKNVHSVRSKRYRGQNEDFYSVLARRLAGALLGVSKRFMSCGHTPLILTRSRRMRIKSEKNVKMILRHLSRVTSCTFHIPKVTQIGLKVEKWDSHWTHPNCSHLICLKEGLAQEKWIQSPHYLLYVMAGYQSV